MTEPNLKKQSQSEPAKGAGNGPLADPRVRVARQGNPFSYTAEFLLMEHECLVLEEECKGSHK